MTTPIAAKSLPTRTVEIIQSMQSRMLMFQLNAQTGNTFKDRTVDDAGLASLFVGNRASFSADLRDYGAQSTEWSDNIGWYTHQGAASALGQGDGAAGAAARINAASENTMHDFFRLDSLEGVGGLLYMCEFQTDTVPAGTEWLMSYGRASNGLPEGGYSPLIGVSGGDLLMGLRLWDAGGAGTNVNISNTGLPLNERLLLGIYMDPFNDTISSYVVNGANDFTVQQTSGPGAGNWPQRSDTTDHSNASGLTVFAANSATPSGSIGTTAASQPQTRNFSLVRFEYDASGIWQQLVEDAFNNPFELSENFRGI